MHVRDRAHLFRPQHTAAQCEDVEVVEQLARLLVLAAKHERTAADGHHRTPCSRTDAHACHGRSATCARNSVEGADSDAPVREDTSAFTSSSSCHSPSAALKNDSPSALSAPLASDVQPPTGTMLRDGDGEQSGTSTQYVS